LSWVPVAWKSANRAGVIYPTWSNRRAHSCRRGDDGGRQADRTVGGGYPSGLLAQIPLQWLMEKASLHGLVFKDTIKIDGDECRTGVHDSFGEMLHGVYRVCKFGKPFYRAIGAPADVVGDKTTSTINETIDASVFDRWRGNEGYRPENLATWAAAQRVDIASLHDPVRADSLLALQADATTQTATPGLV
jgi:hypothetical protein